MIRRLCHIPEGTGADFAAPFRPEPAAVRGLRDRLGLTRAAFARRLGVSAPTVANWESASGTLKLQPRSRAAPRKSHGAAGS